MKRTVRIVAAIGLCLALAGCSASQQASESSAVDTADFASATEMLASLTDGQSSSLEGVSLTPSGPYGIEAGTPEDRIAQSHERAEIGVFSTINGIETTLMIPVWYGDQTLYQSDGAEPAPMTEVEQTASESVGLVASATVWFGGPVVDVQFHTDEGFLILDKVVAPRTH